MNRSKTTLVKVSILCAGLVVLVGVQGCASKKWVRQELAPVEGRVTNVESRVGALDGQVAKLNGQTANLGNRLNAVSGRLDQTGSQVAAVSQQVDNLRLERQVLGQLAEGVEFAVNSTTLPDKARTNIDDFLTRFDGMHEVRFILVGHADRTGGAKYNFELGLRRAISVAKHLITRKGIEPTRVNIRSEGQSGTLGGGDADRRVDVTAYKETIVSSPK